MIKTLIVEDDDTSGKLIQSYLKNYGPCHIANNGLEAVEMFTRALELKEPFNLVCLDIMMPKMDGQETLFRIRRLEETRGIQSDKGAKIIMITALDDIKNVFDSFYELCDSYITKPVRKVDLLDELRKIDLIQ